MIRRVRVKFAGDKKIAHIKMRKRGGGGRAVAVEKKIFVCGSKGLEKVIRMLGPMRRVWRTPVKTNYSDLKFHLPFPVPRPSQPPCAFFSLVGHDRAPCSFRAALRSASCFEDDKRKGNNVMRGDKFASSGVGKNFSNPRGAPNGTPFVVTRNLSKRTL